MSMKLVSIGIGIYRKFSTSVTNATITKIPKWTDEQVQVLDAVSSGKNVFITGAAGTGKTALLREVVKRLEKLHDPSSVYVTASTGFAACALNGQTLHSFAGIGHGKGNPDPEALLDMVMDSPSRHHWKEAKALVIDEAHSISGELFDNLDYIAKFLRASTETWGGIQIVASGDFLQLPPILRRVYEYDKLLREVYAYKKSDRKVYAFQAACWDSTFHFQIELTRIFRQSEPELVEALQNIRKGKRKAHTLRILEKCFCEKEPDSSAVQLCPRSKDAHLVNQKKIKKFGSNVYTYRAVDRGKTKEQFYKKIKLLNIPDEITLAVGARVVLCVNLDPECKLVNGATGTVISFVDPPDDNLLKRRSYVDKICKEKVIPVVKFDSGPTKEILPQLWTAKGRKEIKASRRQLPVQLAYALSIHKSQGMTLDRVYVDLSNAFGFGMVYVALSRVRTLSGLHISGLVPKKIKADPTVLKFYQNFSSKKCKEGIDEQREEEKDEQLKQKAKIICDKETPLNLEFEEVDRLEIGVDSSKDGVDSLEDGIDVLEDEDEDEE